MSNWNFRRPITSAALLARLGQEQGITPAACLAGTALTEAMLADPTATVIAADELQIARNLISNLGAEQPLGLEAGLRYHLTAYGIWGYTLLSSPTLRSAIDIGLRYLDLTYAFCRIRSEIRGDELWLILDDSDIPADMRRFMVERDSAAIMTIQRELFAQAIPVKAVGYRAPEPAYPERLQDIFGVAARYNADCNYAVLDSRLLDLPLPQANPATAAFCESQCQALLSQRQARSGLAAQVRDYLLKKPGHMPDMAATAQALGHSLRTLHRRLNEEKTSFRALTEEVREALAEEFLQNSHLSLTEIADRLGYAEASSFINAFKRWKGHAPRAYGRN